MTEQEALDLRNHILTRSLSRLRPRLHRIGNGDYVLLLKEDNWTVYIWDAANWEENTYRWRDFLVPDISLTKRSIGQQRRWDTVHAAQGEVL